MSSQNNGKKNGSGNTSLNNTPSSTPNAITSNPANQAMHNANPPNNAPKYGTLVPNRIFVGGISANTTEAELLDLFSKHGTVKAAKIIQDRAGVSKGYGFITFETEEEARRIQRESDIILKERRLNIAPAIKKQPFSRTYESTSPPSINSAPAQYYLPTNGLPLFSTGVTYYPQPPPPPPPPGDPNTQQTVYQAQAVYQPPTGPPQTASYPPMVYPTQQIYMPQQFPFPTVPYDYGYFPNGNAAQYVVGNQGAPQHQQPPMQPPGSPTRTSCFNPPIQYGPDTVFFNMPMYGTVEGAPMYSDPMDMNNGNMSEDQPPNACIGNQEPQPITYQPSGLPPLPPPLSHSNYVSSPSQPSCNFTEMTDSENLVINNRQDENYTRSSATPVVSLLMLEQQQERDYRSMQSGRRQKAVEGSGPVMMDNNNCNTYTSVHERHNDYTNHRVPQNMIPTVPSPNIEEMQYVARPPSLQPPNLSGLQSHHNTSRVNHENNNNHAERYGHYKYNNKNTDRYNNNFYYQEHTQSNKNQYEERFRNNNTGWGSYTNNRHNNFSASRRGGFNNNQSNLRRSQYYHNNDYRQRNNVEYTQRNNNYHANHNKGNHRQGMPTTETTLENSNDVDQQAAAVVPTSSNTNDVNFNNTTLIPPQIPIPLSSGGNQNFIPPARKNRRSVRRNTHSGPPLSEIGAGDAPLPSSEVSDACKKLDNLKL